MEDSAHKVLIIEDDQLLQNALSGKLKREGMNVRSASDGIEALSAVRTFQPQLLLLDLKMPKMDGITFLEQVRSQAEGENLPIIILTNSDADDEIINKIVVYHPSYYFRKSDIEMNELVTKIKELLATEEG